MKFSIIYAVLRPEISEQISVGLIIVDGKKINVRYSKNKLAGLKGLFPDKEYKFVSKVITSLKQKNILTSEEAINYLTRYSNNMISVSPLRTLDIEASGRNQDLLYKNYVYNGETKKKSCRK